MRFVDEWVIIISMLILSVLTDFFNLYKNRVFRINNLTQITVLSIIYLLIIGKDSYGIFYSALVIANMHYLLISLIGITEEQLAKKILTSIFINTLTFSLFLLMGIGEISLPSLIVISLLLAGCFSLIKKKYLYIIFTLFVVLLLDMVVNQKTGIMDEKLLIGTGFALFVAGISIRLKFLTISGAIAAFVLAGLLFGLGGIKWSIPILTFFVLSSLLSKIRKRHNEQVELYFEKSGVRDHWQVVANGGLGVFCLIFYFYTSNELYYLLNIVSLAAVCADTWATEIGTYKKTNTYNVLNFHPIQQGQSGGISITGTSGAFLGAFVIVVSGFYWIDPDNVFYFVLVILFGVLGSFIDSILGATIQHQLKCNTCGKITERKTHCGKDTNYHSGYTFINNDSVNFLSAGVTVIILYIVSNFI